MLQYLNIIDATAFVLLLFSAFIGVVRGFTREVLGILGWSGAAGAAFFSAPMVRPYAQLYVKHPLFAEIAAEAVVFVIALVLLTFLNRFVSSTVKGSALGGIDRTLGLLYGILRAGVLIVIAFLGISLLWKPSKWPLPIRTAHITPYAISGAVWLQQWLPQNLLKGLNNDQIKEALDNIHHHVPVEKMIENLSQPLPAADQKEQKAQSVPPLSPTKPSALPSKKPKDGYSKEQIEGLNEVFKKM